MSPKEMREGGKRAPSKRNSRCKGSQVGGCLVCLMDSKEASVAGAAVRRASVDQDWELKNQDAW